MLQAAKRLSLLSVALACGFQPLLAQSPAADQRSDSATRFVVTGALQDEPIKLPEDMTALFSNQDRRVRFQVVKLSTDDRQLFADKVVSIVNPAGETTRIKTDSSGYATLTNVSSGLHAVVISEDAGHSAIPLAIRQVSDEEAKSKARAIKIPLVEVDPSEVLAAVRSTVAPSSVADAEIDAAVVSDSPISDPFDYSITLTDDGTLKGRVVSLLSDPNQIPLAGSQISVFQNQVLLASTFVDANGEFQIGQLAPGYYGLICTSQAGYSAFGFEARTPAQVAARDNGGYTLVSTTMTTMQAGGSSSLPVVLVPQPMMDNVLQSVEEFYAPPLANGVTPISPFGAPGGLGGGLGGAGGGLGGAGGAAGGLGGAGGLVGLAAAGGVAAVAVGASQDNNVTPLPNTNGVP